MRIETEMVTLPRNMIISPLWDPVANERRAEADYQRHICAGIRREAQARYEFRKARVLSDRAKGWRGRIEARRLRSEAHAKDSLISALYSLAHESPDGEYHGAPSADQYMAVTLAAKAIGVAPPYEVVVPACTQGIIAALRDLLVRAGVKPDYAHINADAWRRAYNRLWRDNSRAIARAMAL